MHSSRLYAKNPVFEIVHVENVKVYHLQQNSLWAESCVTEEFHISPRFSAAFFHRDATCCTSCEHHALGGVLLFSVRLVRSAMGEYPVLMFTEYHHYEKKHTPHF